MTGERHRIDTHSRLCQSSSSSSSPQAGSAGCSGATDSTPATAAGGRGRLCTVMPGQSLVPTCCWLTQPSRCRCKAAAPAQPSLPPTHLHPRPQSSGRRMLRSSCRCSSRPQSTKGGGWAAVDGRKVSKSSNKVHRLAQSVMHHPVPRRATHPHSCKPHTPCPTPPAVGRRSRRRACCRCRRWRRRTGRRRPYRSRHPESRPRSTANDCQ